MFALCVCASAENDLCVWASEFDCVLCSDEFTRIQVIIHIPDIQITNIKANSFFLFYHLQR